MEPIQIDVTLEDVEVVNRDGGRSGLVFHYAPFFLPYSDADFWFTKEVLEGMLAKLNDAMEGE